MPEDSTVKIRASGTPGTVTADQVKITGATAVLRTLSPTFGATLELSPASTIGSDVRLRVLDRSTDVLRPADVLVQTRSSIVSLGMLAAYDTAGDSDLEWSFTAGFELSRVDSQQNATASYVDDGTPVSSADLRARCAAARSGCQALVPASICAACCSAVFAGTNRMVGRLIASHSASASAASFLPRLT